MKFAKYLILLIAVSTFSALACAETPSGFLERCVAKLNSAKSITASFSISSSGKTLSGNLISAGKKFTVSVPGAKTWYDGKDLWSYSRANGEVTVWTPTAAELAESNPLLYLGTAKEYNVALSPKSIKGTRTIVLTPRKRNTGVKQVNITVSTSTLLPSAISVKASSGNCDIKIKSILLNKHINPTIFKFNKKDYPGVSVTDLR